MNSVDLITSLIHESIDAAIQQLVDAGDVAGLRAVLTDRGLAEDPKAKSLLQAVGHVVSLRGLVDREDGSPYQLSAKRTRKLTANQVDLRRAEKLASRLAGRLLKPVVTEGQTDSPEFARWFAGSKVVDAGGNPLRVYHGTDKDFSVFELNGEQPGPWFSISPDTASRYADIRGRWNDDRGDNVKPVYLSIKNPARYDDMDRLSREFRSRTGNRVGSGKFVRDTLISKGHDGVEVDNGDSWIVFSSSQVKSATGNSGKFDASSPRITEKATLTLKPHGGKMWVTKRPYGNATLHKTTNLKHKRIPMRSSP